jgi:hypothetical protein
MNQGLFWMLPSPPGHGFFGSQGGFVDIPVRRMSREATEHQFPESKGIGTSENTPDILQTTQVAQDSHDRNFGVIFELVQIRSVQFGHGLEAHGFVLGVLDEINQTYEALAVSSSPHPIPSPHEVPSRVDPIFVHNPF